MQDDIAFFPLNSIYFAIYPRENLARDAGISEEKTGFPAFTLAYLTRSEDEVDQVLEKARGRGGRILKPGQKTVWGRVWRIFCRS